MQGERSPEDVQKKIWEQRRETVDGIGGRDLENFEKHTLCLACRWLEKPEGCISSNLNDIDYLRFIDDWDKAKDDTVMDHWLWYQDGDSGSYVKRFSCC